MTRARDESGFTLIELAMAATISFVLFAATLTVLTSLISQRNRVEKQAEVETQARQTVDRMARQLRNLASPADVITSVAVSTQPKSIDRNLTTDLIFKDVAESMPAGSANSANVRRVRYCLQTTGAAPGLGFTASPARAVLWMQTQTWTTALPPAVPLTTDCPGTGWPDTRLVADYLVNAAQTPARPLFRYSSDAGAVTATTPAAREAITRVEASVMVDRDATQSPEAATLTSSVLLRNQNRAPTAAFSYTQLNILTCNVQLNASASQDPESKPLRFEWYLDGSATKFAEGVVVQKVVGIGTHSYRLKVYDPAGLVGEHTETHRCPI